MTIQLVPVEVDSIRDGFVSGTGKAFFWRIDPLDNVFVWTEGGNVPEFQVTGTQETYDSLAQAVAKLQEDYVALPCQQCHLSVNFSLRKWREYMGEAKEFESSRPLKGFQCTHCGKSNIFPKSEIVEACAGLHSPESEE